MKKYFVVMFAVLCAQLACAQQSAPTENPPPPRGRHGEPPGPPPEAFAVCKGKNKGDEVTVTFREGRSVKAVCEVFPGNGQLAARPVDMPPSPPPRDEAGSGRPPG